MKKAKIMLLTIVVLATVGNVLAFKVVKKGTTTYCYEETNVQPEHCLEEINQATAVPGNLVFITLQRLHPVISWSVTTLATILIR